VADLLPAAAKKMVVVAPLPSRGTMMVEIIS